MELDVPYDTFFPSAMVNGAYGNEFVRCATEPCKGVNTWAILATHDSDFGSNRPK